MQIVRKFLSADEVSAPNQRYNADCDCIQVSPDGGTTWNDDPGADPRHNPAALLPPRGGGTAQCDAAEAMTQHFKSLVDAFISAGTVLGTVNIWVALLFFIPGVNVLIALLLSIADALFTTGVVVVDAAMTEGVYEQIKCILFCNIDANGQMSAEQLTVVYSEVETLIGGVPSAVFQTVTSAWGEVGFSNAGASGEYVGDCDECACQWCYTWDFTVSDWGFQAQSDIGITVGHYVGGTGWQSNQYEDACSNHGYTYILLDLGMTVDNISSALVETTPTDLSAYYFDQMNGATIVRRDNMYNGYGTEHGGTVVPTSCDRIEMAFNACGSSYAITRLTLRGTGDNPFGEDNC